jgi:hypothetical protein
MSKKQLITIAVPLNCNEHTCGKCSCMIDSHHGTFIKCSVFGIDLNENKRYELMRLPQCKAAEIAPEGKVEFDSCPKCHGSFSFTNRVFLGSKCPHCGKVLR